MEHGVLILVHVMSGLIWGGGMMITGFFFLPSIVEAGPGGGAVMAGVMKRRYSLLMTICAVLAVLSGARLYSLHFSAEWLRSSHGLVLTLGSLLALVAWFLGFFRQKPLAQKMAALAAAGKHAEIPPVAQALAKTGRIAAWHVLGAAVLMAGHRLFAQL